MWLLEWSLLLFEEIHSDPAIFLTKSESCNSKMNRVMILDLASILCSKVLLKISEAVNSKNFNQDSTNQKELNQPKGFLLARHSTKQEPKWVCVVSCLCHSSQEFTGSSTPQHEHPALLQIWREREESSHGSQHPFRWPQSRAWYVSNWGHRKLLRKHRVDDGLRWRRVNIRD